MSAGRVHRTHRDFPLGPIRPAIEDRAQTLLRHDDFVALEAPQRGLNRSAGFLVGGVLAIPLAVFLHFDALAVVRLVLGGDVVPTLALLAFECDGNAFIG